MQLSNCCVAILVWQACGLLSITTHDWGTKHQQPRMARWFEMSYGTSTHVQWFIGAAGGRLPNWDPNANPIESWHNTLGDITGVIERASFTTMLEVNIPAICKDASLHLTAHFRTPLAAIASFHALSSISRVAA